MRGEADDFLVLLGIALGILIALVLIFGFFGTSFGNSGTRTVFSSYDDLGVIGFTNELPTKEYTLQPFIAGKKQLDSIKKVPELTLSSNLFSAERFSDIILIPSYYSDSMTGVKLTFDVFKTNNGGSLRILWNSKTVFLDTPSARPQSVFIPKEDVKTTNSLDIIADGPGIAFWATNSFTLRDVIVSVEYGPAKLFAVDLSNRDIQSLSKGEISFFSLADQGLLQISINGVPIFQKNSKGAETVNFTLTSAPFHIGTNIFSFSATGGEFDIRNGELNIYTFGNQKTVDRVFSIDENKLNSIPEGTITLTIGEVSRPGGITVTLNGEEILAESAHTGVLTATFDKSLYAVGTNTISVTSTGTVTVNELKIGG